MAARVMHDVAGGDETVPDFSGLRAMYINCTLTPTPRPSHTQTLMDRSMALMRSHGVAVTSLRAVDHDIAPGVQPDMTQHGAPVDAWPAIAGQVLGADILVLGTPIWLGDKSSVCTRVIERLYALSGQMNPAGQYVFYGRAGGCLVTGNEDGIKHCAMNILYSLQHLGYTVPPQADAGWIGEAGPGPSYGDDGAGFDNDFTDRNTTFMTYNLMHVARLLRAHGGFPVYGNQRRLWDVGQRFGFDLATVGRRAT